MQSHEFISGFGSGPIFLDHIKKGWTDEDEGTPLTCNATFGFCSMGVEKAIPAGGDKPRPYIYSGLPVAYHPGATAKRRLRSVGVGFMPTRFRFTEICRHPALLSGT